MIVELALANHNRPSEWINEPWDLVITAIDVLATWEREARNRG